jgi:glycosyltransferase involved in cell wall biosynthesis
MKILNIYNVVTNTSIPYELECYMADKFKSDVFSHLRLKTIGDLLKNFWKTFRAIGDSDVIHSHHTFSSLIVSFFRVFFLGTEKLFVCTVHRDYRSAGTMTELVFGLFVFPFRDKIICNSYATKASLPRYIKHFFPERIVVVYNGINLSSIDCSINFSSDRLELVNIGRLVPGKDQITLLRMCSILSKRNIDYHLTICGGGPLEEFLLQQIKKLNLTDRVSLAGNISRSEVYKTLRDSSIYISTSVSEGFGNSTIEAMAAGCPTVLVDILVNTEIVGCSQLMFAEGDYEVLSNLIIKLGNDESYFRKVALDGEKKSKNYSLEAAAYGYYSIYRD